MRPAQSQGAAQAAATRLRIKQRVQSLQHLPTAQAAPVVTTGCEALQVAAALAPDASAACKDEMLVELHEALTIALEDLEETRAELDSTRAQLARAQEKMQCSDHADAEQVFIRDQLRIREFVAQQEAKRHRWQEFSHRRSLHAAAQHQNYHFGLRDRCAT
jgi:hypothetical protein